MANYNSPAAAHKPAHGGYPDPDAYLYKNSALGQTTGEAPQVQEPKTGGPLTQKFGAEAVSSLLAILVAIRCELENDELTVTGRINLGDQPVPQNLPRTKWMIECNFGNADDWVSSNRFIGLRFDSKADAEDAIRSHKDFNFRKDTGRYRAVPATIPTPPKQEGWIVQYINEDHNTGHSLAVTVWGRIGYGDTGRDVYSSRNEAYRQMRKRSVRYGIPLSRYRVVPAGTPDGAEKDRGYYTVQFWWDKDAGWVETVGGPGACAKSKFGSSGEAQAAIRVYGSRRETYRVKWHPSAS